jgi:hypothetical protein
MYMPGASESYLGFNAVASRTGTHAYEDSRHLEVTGIAIGRAQAQHASRRNARQR